MSNSVIMNREGPVATLRLNRPQVLNAIDAQVCNELCKHMAELESDDTTCVVVISGSGSRAFSAGADLNHMRTMAEADLPRFIEQTWICFERISQSPLPSIAALHGYVLGGGLELALACDFRLADPSTRIALPEMTLGSVPGSGAMQRLPKLIGESKTLELAIFGTRLNAEEAAALGIVNKVVHEIPVEQAAMEWARQISERQAEALRYAKIAIRARGDPVLSPALHGLISGICHRSKQYEKGTDKFVT